MFRSRNCLLTCLTVLSLVWMTPALADNDAPLESQLAFGRYVRDIYKQDHPKSRVRLGESGRLLRIDGLEIGLENLYRYLKLQGENWDRQDAEIRRFLAGGSKDYLQSQSWAEVKPIIVPRLIPAGYLETNADFVHQSVVAEFALAYAVDFPEVYVYLLAEHLRSWGIDRAELHQAAVANLQARFKDQALQDSAAGPGKQIVVELGDLSATAIMLPAFRARLLEQLGNPFLATVASGNRLVSWSTDAATDTQNRVQAQRDFESAPQAISPEVYVVTASSLEADHSKAVMEIQGQTFVMDFSDDEATEPEQDTASEAQTDSGDASGAPTGGDGECDLAASSIAYMDMLEVLTDRVAAGQADQAVVNTFFAETEHMGPLMTTDPARVCRELDALRPKYGLNK